MTSRTLLVSSCALALSVLLAGGAAADVTDLVPPSIDVAPPSVTNSQTAQFGFSSDDGGVTYSCSLDEEPFVPCESPKEYELLVEGPHTFAVRTSRGALEESSPATHNWLIDLTPPVFAAVGASQVVEQTAPPGAVATYGPPATDELDPAPKVDCLPPSGAVFPVGVTTVSCRATDWAGNSAETQFTVTVANTIRPAPVQGLRAQAAKSRVGLSWQSPADWDYDRLVVRRAPRETSMWRVVYEGRSGTTFTDRDVQNDTEYVYEAAVYDTAGNVSASTSTQARPSAFLLPRWNAALKRPPTLRWAAVRRAAYYNIQVWRNGRKILSRWPGGPRFRLQRTWTHQGRRYSLRDGTYFAYAWPGFGPQNAGRYGRLIGWTKFRIS
jgi:hypothetical protein